MSVTAQLDIPGLAHLHGDLSAAHGRLYAMTDGVFHQRLQKQGRQLMGAQLLSTLTLYSSRAPRRAPAMLSSVSTSSNSSASVEVGCRVRRRLILR